MSIEDRDRPHHNTPNSGAVSLSPSTSMKPQQTQDQATWNTANLPLRLSADVASAASAAILIAPVVTVIDRAIVSKAATGTAFRTALRHSMQPVLQTPHRFLTSKPFLLILTLYTSTYSTANLLDTTTSTLHNQAYPTVSSGAPKFLATSTVNMSLCVYKDSCFARIFGAAATGTRSPIPKTTYLLFALRDSLTIFASFNLPPLLTPYLPTLPANSQPAFLARLLSNPTSRANTTQFLAPAAMQIFSTPLHLLGLDLFNRQGQTLAVWDRVARVRRDWAVSALARMGRIVPAFGVGGVVNAGVRRRLMAALEARE